MVAPKKAKTEKPKKSGVERKFELNGNLGMPIVSFDVQTNGEVIKIIRISDHFAWRWDNPRDGKSYGDFTIQPPFQEPKVEKEIASLMEQVKVATGGKKIKIEKRLTELVTFYEQLRTEDVGNLLAVLVEQADMTIDKIRGENN